MQSSPKTWGEGWSYIAQMMVLIDKGVHCLSWDISSTMIGLLLVRYSLGELSRKALLHATLLLIQHIKAHSHYAFFSHCNCDSSCRNKWVAQDSMEVFTLCDCDNITNSYVTQCKQKTNRSRNQEKSHCVNKPLCDYLLGHPGVCMWHGDFDWWLQ